MSLQSNEKGFTLIELLVALTLMAIGILAVVQMQIVAIKSNSIAQKLTVATNIAQEVMDDILSWDVSRPPPFAPATVFTASQPEAQVTFLTDPRLATARDQTTLTFPDSGTYRALYTVTLNPAANTAVIMVRVMRLRPEDNVFEERVRITSFKRVV